jgi:hypothetical protein
VRQAALSMAHGTTGAGVVCACQGRGCVGLTSNGQQPGDEPGQQDAEEHREQLKQTQPACRWVVVAVDEVGVSLDRGCC